MFHIFDVSSNRIINNVELITLLYIIKFGTTLCNKISNNNNNASSNKIRAFVIIISTTASTTK